MARNSTLGYRIRNNIGRGFQQYAELHLEVRTVKAYDSPIVCRFQWQAGMLNDRPASEGFSEWYAGRMHVESDSFDLVSSLRGVTRIARLLSNTSYQRGPLATVRTLEAAGINRIEYDNVISQFVPVEDLTMAPLASWRDDYARTGEVNCRHHVTADTAEMAQRLMLKAFGAEVGRDDGAALRRWIDAGKPVIRMNTGAVSVTSVFDAIGATAEVASAKEATTKVLPQEQIA